jgi:SAM-dependent methyltransferase
LHVNAQLQNWRFGLIFGRVFQRRLQKMQLQNLRFERVYSPDPAGANRFSYPHFSSRQIAMTEVVSESIYDHPKYYDLVFGADCAAEMKFIRQCGERFASGKVRKLFEPACGTGRLLVHLAKHGYGVAGIDLNPKAVEFCNQRLARKGIRGRAWVADMSDFTAPAKYDVAFNTINSFRHLLTQQQALGHLRSMGNCIRRGGLYLLGVHITPNEAAPSDTESWSARRGHVGVNTHMWTIDRNKRTRIERFGIRFDIHTPSRNWRIEDMLVLRSYTAEQMRRLIRDSEVWQCEETYDFHYQIARPIVVDASSEDVVYILRRR